MKLTDIEWEVDEGHAEPPVQQGVAYAYVDYIGTTRPGRPNTHYHSWSELIHSMRQPHVSIVDRHGYEWIYDGTRVYMVLAEEEMRANGDNGYPVGSAIEAYDLLREYGYL